VNMFIFTLHDTISKWHQNFLINCSNCIFAKVGTIILVNGLVLWKMMNIYTCNKRCSNIWLHGNNEGLLQTFDEDG
jgi:hypothetical protein